MSEFILDQAADAPEWSAYHKAAGKLEAAGFVVGSMQRGFPTVAMFGFDYVSKWTNMTRREQQAAHALIEGPGGSFRSGPIKVTISPECPAAGVEAFARLMAI